MATNQERAKLYTLVAEHWGLEAADTLMSTLPPWDYDQVATKADLALLRGEFGELRGEFGELRGDFGRLEGKVEGMFGRLIAINAGMMLSFAGLVISVIKFF